MAELSGLSGVVELIEQARAVREESRGLRAQACDLRLACRHKGEDRERQLRRARSAQEQLELQRGRLLSLGLLPWRRPDERLSRTLVAVD